MLCSAVLRQRFLLPAPLKYYHRTAKMSLKAISSKDAASLDQDLMESGGWSLDQLMELAGLSVSQAVYRVHPTSSGKNILVICGPGNNGGDGLVAARHLAQYGYTPSIYYPKEGKKDLYSRLKTQLTNLSVPFINTAPEFQNALTTSAFIIDAIFGFSFGGPLRDPFPEIISQIEASSVPVLAVDAPSSWDVERGPPKEGPGAGFMPEYLISLTAPKPCVKFYKGRHFVGGRFLTRGVAEKFGLDLPKYPGIDQVVEVGVDAEGRL
ncbi:YjeF N-terminal domain-containing protein [Aspergillus cavernicola]|uniref:NAD(P)H-hydrate epimerase n=1 Tax=Aspergillus cavernicola TaxID=176166 RepID=A0ABR4HSE9_9EURO